VKKHIYLTITSLLTICLATAQKHEISLGREVQPSQGAQQSLRQSQSWQDFTAHHGMWWVEFNELTGLPHRAMGNGIATTGDRAQAARSHLTAYLGDPGFPLEQLSVLDGRNTTYVHFQQRYQGLKVWFSHAQVRFNEGGQINMFGMDLFPDVQVNTIASISESGIESFAAAGLSGVGEVTVSELGVLPVAQGDRYVYHLVYEVMVEALDAYGNPAMYFTLVDAHDGEVLLRQNRVHTCGDHMSSGLPPVAVEADVNGTVTDNPLQSTTVRGLPYVRVNINGTDYYTDANGHLNQNLATPVTATVYLEGLWAQVYKGSATNPSSFTTTLSAGTNTISFDSHASSTEISAYYHVSVQHDFMKSLLPGFTTLDVPMETNVDQSGSCNAFYNGAVNFYVAGGGCPATALFSDVVYHEYGHGINYDYYDHLGGNFSNGAMQEGYADMWGIMHTLNPILGEGFHTAPSSFVRRYDQAPKVYPQDIVGEVHADGEIIAGAWWDTYINLGNDMATTSALFIESHNGLAMAPSGQEGRLYRDILLDVLLADDTDGNILNGTPNDNAIIEAFARHGITLLTNATFFHNPMYIAAANQPIDVEALFMVEVDFVPFVGDMTLSYRTHKDSAWHEVSMPNVVGNDYAGQIPPQPKATIVDYYIEVTDIYGNSAVVDPFLADDTNPNLPHQVLVGFAVQDLEDFDNQFGNWEPDPFATDDAATGSWVFEPPVASYTDQFHQGPTTICQTGTDHTTNSSSNICAVTGNATLNDTHGTNDVDDGRTTMLSPVYDLTTYNDPAFAYWRWYTNNQGANPANDVWQVFITDDMTNWVNVERTNITDRSWRRKAIKVQDYVSLSSTVALLFIAQDSVIPSNPTFQGGSVVEAAVDDLYLYDEFEDTTGSGYEALTNLDARVYPNPASGVVWIRCETNEPAAYVQLCDVLGEVIATRELRAGAAAFDVSGLEAAVYTVRIVAGEATKSLKVVVAK
jgi:hypothetical protein